MNFYIPKPCWICDTRVFCTTKVGNIDQEPEAIADILQQEAERVLGVTFSSFKYKSAHLWRYAAPKKVAEQPYFLDQTHHLAVCGDWCVAGRVEGAFLSALALSKAIL